MGVRFRPDSLIRRTPLHGLVQATHWAFRFRYG
ncbi:Uncharacterised protein [Vibrio cholerae]|nr:Uncharacterised protein [Vibrio cholerae]